MVVAPRIESIEDAINETIDETIDEHKNKKGGSTEVTRLNLCWVSAQA